MKIAVLDDYAENAKDLGDWDSIPGAEVTFFKEHVVEPDALFLPAGAEGDDGEALGLPAMEQAGAVNAGKNADFGGELAELVGGAAVGAVTIFEDGAPGFGFEYVGEGGFDVLLGVFVAGDGFNDGCLDGITFGGMLVGVGEHDGGADVVAGAAGDHAEELVRVLANYCSTLSWPTCFCRSS